ncbi:MAG: hypothetical protein ACREP6_08670 [Candidatus Binataceae bacterium]
MRVEPDNVLAGFVLEMEKLISVSRGDSEIAAKGVPILRRLLETRTFALDRYRITHSDRPAQFELYRAPEGALSITLIVWAPGQRSAPHDHGVWGLVGMLEGGMREYRYRRIDDKARADWAELELVSARDTRRGDISRLVPPDDDIHGLENLSGAPVFEIHVYGRDLLRYPRNRFDLATNRVRPFMTMEYDVLPKVAGL